MEIDVTSELFGLVYKLPINFSTDEVENAEKVDGIKSVSKERSGVSAIIDKYDDDFVSVYISDFNGNNFPKAFQSDKAVEEAVAYANEILKEEVYYNLNV